MLVQITALYILHVKKIKRTWHWSIAPASFRTNGHRARFGMSASFLIISQRNNNGDRMWRECDVNIRTSHDRWLRHPLSGWLYMGNWHSEQYTGARADPKQLVASQQCGNPETRGLVLPDYVIATCSKFNASVKISAGSDP